MPTRFLRGNSDLVLIGSVIGILVVLFAPIPPMLLDLLIISNFAFGLTILMMTFYVERPVAFSTFPSLLLVATLYRLALNVAATRLILTEAHAGEVIGSIGSFAVQGSFVVGLVVFFILVVVQYVVVTSGAQRVSEVAARFVLDSMPGQQMSIDADLNMGLIDQNEAKRRRKDLEREAAFYGSMDGASKFVKGDAVAGIIILLINIFAGWIIGVLQMQMDWLEALQTFSLLTIGDGIVTQIPALIISVATGIIVTRSGADRHLSQEIVTQLTSAPKIPPVLIVALLLLLAMPGMPKWPILILIVAVGAMWWAVRRGRVEALAGGSDDDLILSGDESDHAPAVIEARLGRDLSEHWRSLKPLLMERIANLRAQRERTSGFAIPAVTFSDGEGLGAHEYEIALFGARYAKGAIYPEMTLAIRPNGAVAVPGLEVRDPAYGLPAVWVAADGREVAANAGYTLVDPVTALITHLGEVMRAEAPTLLLRAEVVRLLEGVRPRQPGLVEDLIPATLTVSDVQRVLQSLLTEEVSIRNMDLIVEAMLDIGRRTKDPAEIAEHVRLKLSHVIFSELRGAHDQLAVLSLHPRIEAQLAESVRQLEASDGFVIDPNLAEQLLRRIVVQVETMSTENLNPVLLCGAELRRHLKTFTRRAAPRLAVVSVSEVPHFIDLRSFGVISVD